MPSVLKVLLVLVAGVSGCAVQTYSPQPLAPQELASEFSARSADAPGLRDYMFAQGLAGAEWPLRSWGLKELTALAFYYHPDIRVARAQAAVAKAGEITARQRLNPWLKVLPEHHSRAPEGESAWALGFELEIPTVVSDKRAAMAEHAAYLAGAAALDFGVSAWQARSRVRGRFLDYYAALKELDVRQAEHAARTEVLALLERRLAVGIASSMDVDSARSGASEAQAKARTDLIVHALIGGFGILLLLYVAFGNYRNVLLTLVNLPFALVGGVAAVLAGGGWLSLGSLVGFVTLFGITLRNSIMLVSHCQYLVQAEGMKWKSETKLRGASERLPSILMTALGLLPLALGSGQPGREIEGPMTTIIVGGLVTSTVLNLLILPTLLLHYGKFDPAKDR